MLKLLLDPDHKTFYGSFTPPEKILPDKKKDFSPSMDGTQGIRIVRQHTEDGWLRSSLQSYVLKNGKILPRSGVDALRVRFQIGPFRESGSDKKGNGVLGFSWTTRVDEEGKLQEVFAEPYVTRDKARAFGVMHPSMKYDNVTPCAFATHCNVCHHAERLNTFSDHYVEGPLRNQRGFRQLMTEILRHEDLSQYEDSIRNALLSPKETFATKDLIRALVARWEKVKPKGN